MGRTVRFRKECQREFQKEFSRLCNTRQSWQVWSDFVEVSAIAISNALDHESEDSKKWEERYRQIITPYSTDEQNTLASLLGLVVETLETEPGQDFLGEIFMGLELGNHWRGQFFTPYNVCQMIAEMQVGDAKALVEKRGWFSINDPCCGAGALLIAARNVLTQKHIGHTEALFIAQDIDRTAALMCYIQLSLLGCAGYVVIADSLRYPLCGSPLQPVFSSEQDVWFTPMFYDPVWQGRILWSQIDALFRMPPSAPAPPRDGVETPPSPALPPGANRGPTAPRGSRRRATDAILTEVSE